MKYYGKEKCKILKQIRAEIAKQFSAACCDDDATRAKIADVWKQSGYLIHSSGAIRLILF